MKLKQQNYYMNSEEDLMCMHCKGSFTQENPPRMLTMCGHTFCDSCIKSLIVKKKMNNRFKLVCPQDKNSIDLTSNSTSFFPKNIQLLKILQTKTKGKGQKILNHLPSMRISNIDVKKFKSQQSLVTFDFDQCSCNQSSIAKNKSIGSNSIIFPLDQIQADICLLHQKPLDIVCVRDCIRICPSCAIFGQHKTHQMKSLAELQDLKKKMQKSIKNLLGERKRMIDKLNGKQLWSGVEKSIEKKKKEMGLQIKKKFKLLQEMILKAEKKAVSDLQRKFLETQKRIKKKLEYNDQNFENWQERAQQKISTLNGTNDEEKYRTILKPQDLILTGQKLVNNLKRKEEGFGGEAERLIEKLTLVFNVERMTEVINEFCCIEQYENSFLGIEDVSHLGLKINQSLQFQQESLLEGGQQNIPKHLKSTQNFMVCSKEVKNSMCSSHSKSSNKKGTFLRSPKSGLKLGSINNISSCRSLNGKTLQNYFKAKPKFKLNQKYEKNISNLLSGNTDTLDLTNGELGDQKVESVLDNIKEKGMTIVKLGRNKLSDEGFSKILPFLGDIIMLNISKNDLTQKTLDSILANRKIGELRSLKSVMIGQNKIQERKHKSKIEEIKSMGINVCI